MMLLKDLAALRDKSFLKYGQDRIDAVDVDIPGKGKFELRQIPGFPVSWKIYSSDGSNAKANSQMVDNLLRQLSLPNIVQGFPPPGTKDDAMGFDKPEVELKLWEKGTLPGEKPDPNAKPKVKDQPSFRVIFGKATINPGQVYARAGRAMSKPMS